MQQCTCLDTSTVKFRKPAKRKSAFILPVTTKCNKFTVSRFSNWGCKISHCWCYLKSKQEITIRTAADQVLKWRMLLCDSLDPRQILYRCKSNVCNIFLLISSQEISSRSQHVLKSACKSMLALHFI